MHRNPPHLYIGLDLGQRQDPSAVAILQRIHEPTGEWDHVNFAPVLDLYFELIHVERFPLGTRYLDIVDKVRELIRDCSGRIKGTWPVQAGHQANPHKTLVIDATGVGAPIVELFQRHDMAATAVPVMITAAGVAHQDRLTYLVPRLDLVTNLRVLLEAEKLRFPQGLHDKAALREEILNLQDRPGHRHDDMAIALALAAWQATRTTPRSTT